MKGMQAWVTETFEHGAADLESIARAAALKAARPSLIQNASVLERRAVVAASIPELLGKLKAASPREPRKETRSFVEIELSAGHGGSAEAASFIALHCAAAAFIEDLGLMPSLICGHGAAGEVASFTTAGVLRAADGIKLASQRCAVSNSFWPPTVPLASQHGLLSERPDFNQCHDFKPMTDSTDPRGTGIASAVESLQCDVIMEISLGCPSPATSLLAESNKIAPQVVTAHLGSPVDGRIVSSDLAERAILEAAAALYSLGGIQLAFAGALGEGPVARLPPTAVVQKVCWPSDPAANEWRRQDLFSDVYEDSWLSPETFPTPETVHRFLVSGGDAALHMASVLSQRGCKAKVGDPSAPTDASTVFVFILDLPKPSQLRATLDAARSQPHALLQWLRALPRRCKAAILSVGAHGSEVDLRYMPAAAAWGAARSARQELGSVSLRCIDLDPVNGRVSQGLETFNCFADELTCHANEVRDVLIVPPHGRKVRVLQSLHVPLQTGDSQSSQLTFPETFGITGGTGALGLMISEWLTCHGTKSLVLASRSGKVPEQNSKLWQALSQKSSSLCLQLCKCDVSENPTPLADALKSADGTFGLAHLAGVLHDGRFTNQRFENIDMTMKPKVDGAALLVDILRSVSTEHAAQRLKHLWLFSSVTSCLGNMGQTAYGAANSALDAMGRAWWPGDVVGPIAGATISLQWGPWADFGMASALPEGSTSIFKPWKGDQALLALKATLLGASCPVVCLTQFNWQKVRLDFDESSYYRGFMGEVCREKSNVARSVGTPCAGQVPDFSDLKSAVIETLQKFLPNGIEGLTDDAEFDELGLDSLSGVEASRSLAIAVAPFGVMGLKPTFLFEANCLKQVLEKCQRLQAVPKQSLTPAALEAKAKPASQASSADIKQAVVDSLSRFLPNGLEGLTDTAEFDELGLDSLSGVEASRALAAALNPLGITGIKPTFLFEANSLESLLAKNLVRICSVDQWLKGFLLLLPMGENTLQMDKEGPQKESDPAPSIPLQATTDPEAATLACLNIHSIGEASPFMRQLFGFVSASLCWFLKVSSYGPFWLFVMTLPRHSADQVEQDALFVVMFFLLASVAQLFVALLVMWTAKNLFLGTVKDGIWPIWGWKMACLKGIRLFEDFLFSLPIMKALERSEMPNFVWRLMGSHVGRGAYISHSDDLPIIAWDLLSIGENAIIDGMNICGSNPTFHFHRPLSIGSGCVAWLH
eukprot:Skav224285  [mRNA]  locus=scaffold1019:121214:126748:+ [translate_table: standard]